MFYSLYSVKFYQLRIGNQCDSYRQKQGTKKKGSVFVSNSMRGRVRTKQNEKERERKDADC